MSTIPEILAGTAVEIVIFGVAGGILYRVWRGASFLPQRTTLLPYNKGVVLEGERLVKILDPGSYWIKPRQTLIPVDVRARPFQMEPREVLSSDGWGVRIRAQGEYKVKAPDVFVRESRDGHAAFYLSLDREVALVVSELDRGTILGSGFSCADRIRERIEPRAAQLGIVVTQLEVSDLLPLKWIQASPDD